jgi:hypothetical protein
MIDFDKDLQNRKNLVFRIFEKLATYEWKLQRLNELLERGKVEIQIKSSYDSNDMITIGDDIDKIEFLNTYKGILEDKYKDTTQQIKEMVNYVSEGETPKN